MAFPQTLTNAVDKQTPILAAHLNNLEVYVGIVGSSDTNSLTYKLTSTSQIDPGHKHTHAALSGTMGVDGDILHKASGAWSPKTPDAAGIVDKSSSQTIGGAKTFSVIPILPGTDPTQANEAARKGYVDGAISSHASLPNVHHNQVHDIQGADHTASGLTAGQVLRATGATSFAFQAIQADDLPSGINALKIGAGLVNNTEFGYLSGVTSAIQSQIDAKLPTATYQDSASIDPGHKHSKLWASDGDPVAITVDAAGNVGIGTASPAAKLEVRGGVRAGTNGTEFQVSTAGNITAGTYNGITITSGTGTLTLNTKTFTLSNSLTLAGADGKTVNFGANNLTFSTTGDCTLTVSGSGTVALGTGATNYLARWIGTNTLSTGVVYDNGTNVGIGTTDVSTYKLNINGTINATGYYLNGAPFSGGGGPDPGTLTGQTLYWNGSAWAASSNLFNNNTNVGIGTTNPSNAKLQVAGTGRFEGTLTVTTGGITVTGNSTISGTLGSLTGLTSSGAITFSGLSSGGLVKAGSGTGTLALATPATDYIAGGVGAASQVAYFTGQGVLSGSNNLYFNGTNVGIGTTDVSTYRLNVNGTVNTGPLTATSFNGNIITSGSGTLTLNSKTLTVNNSLTFAGGDGKTIDFGANNLTFSTSAACTLTIPTSGTVALGTGTSNYLTRWTGTNSLSTGVVYDNGTNVGIGTTDVSTYKLNVNGTINTTGYYLNGVPFTGGGGTQAKTLVQTDLNVAANSSQQFNLTGFLNRGLGHYLKVEETGGLVTGTYDVEIYEEDTFTTLLYRAQGIIPTTSYEDWLPFWVEDADNTQELHLKIYNHDSSWQGTYKITLKAEMFA